MNSFNIEIGKTVYSATPKRVYQVGKNYLVNYEVNGESYNGLLSSMDSPLLNITDPENISLLGKQITQVEDMVFPSIVPFGKTTTIGDMVKKTPSKETIYKRQAFLSESFNIDEHTAFGIISKLENGRVVADYYKSEYPLYTPEGDFTWKYDCHHIGSRNYHSLNALVKYNMGNDTILFDGVAYSIEDYLIKSKGVTVIDDQKAVTCIASDYLYHFNRDKLKYEVRDQRASGDVEKLPKAIDLRTLTAPGRK